MDHLLEDGVHYISVKPDLSDLIDKIKYCKENDERCMEIANRGMEIANRLLTKPNVVSAFENTLWDVYSKLNPVVPTPESIPGPLSSISESLPSALSSLRDSLPSSLSTVRDLLPTSPPSPDKEPISTTILSSPSPNIPVPIIKKKTRKIKIVSDEVFFRNKDASNTKKPRCRKGTRRNKIGNCEEIQTKKRSSSSPLSIQMKESKPKPMKEPSISSIHKKGKRCPKGSRKNKFGECEKIQTKKRSSSSSLSSLIPLKPVLSPSPILVNPLSPIFMQEPPVSISSANKKNKRERCPNGTRRNKDGICVPK